MPDVDAGETRADAARAQIHLEASGPHCCWSHYYCC